MITRAFVAQRPVDDDEIGRRSRGERSRPAEVRLISSLQPAANSSLATSTAKAARRPGRRCRRHDLRGRTRRDRCDSMANREGLAAPVSRRCRTRSPSGSRTRPPAHSVRRAPSAAAPRAAGRAARRPRRWTESCSGEPGRRPFSTIRFRHGDRDASRAMPSHDAADASRSRRRGRAVRRADEQARPFRKRPSTANGGNARGSYSRSGIAFRSRHGAPVRATPSTASQRKRLSSPSDGLADLARPQKRRPFPSGIVQDRALLDWPAFSNLESDLQSEGNCLRSKKCRWAVVGAGPVSRSGRLDTFQVLADRARRARRPLDHGRH